jgi:hypothetical protein
MGHPRACKRDRKHRHVVLLAKGLRRVGNSFRGFGGNDFTHWRLKEAEMDEAPAGRKISLRLV